MSRPLFYLSIILLTASGTLSCRLDKPDPLPERPKCTVRLVLDRETGVEESDEPLQLSKTSANDLYAVQIYKKGNRSYSLTPSMYGIFDDETLITLPLEFDKLYKIEVSQVPNGKNLIARGDNGGYNAPFWVGGLSGNPGKVNNQFVVTSMNNFIQGINKGTAKIIQTNGTQAEYDWPPISRFYGVIEDYRPEEGGEVVIPLKLVGFGLTIVPQRFSEGTIEIKINFGPTFTLTPENPRAITKQIFTFKNPKNQDWTEDDYSEEIGMSIVWTKADREKVTFRTSTDPITVRRKTNKILTLPCGDKTSNSIVFDREDDTLTDDHETLAPRP